MQNWILTSVNKFYKTSQEILLANKARFFIEMGSSNGKCNLIPITNKNENLIEPIVMDGMDNYSYRRFIILSNPNIEICLEKSIYDQPIKSYIIEGTGGRETEDIIECIYLRLPVITKEADKTAKILYKKLYLNLESNNYFYKGFKQTTAMHKKALYDIRAIHKIKRYSFNNPLSILDIKRDEETF